MHYNRKCKNNAKHLQKSITITLNYLFFGYYNKNHHHSGIGLVTPEQLHYGMAQDFYDQRCISLENAFEKNPERFRRKKPLPPALPEAAWINKPKQEKPDVIRA